MGLDCSLLIRDRNHVREIQLDRAYAFMNFDFPTNTWLSPKEASEKLNSYISLDKKDENIKYIEYWQIYAKACIDQIPADNMQVGIFDEQNEIIFRIYLERENIKKDYKEKDFIDLGDYLND